MDFLEFLIIGIVLLISNILLQFIFDYNRKELENLGEDKELDELAKKYPSNIEMCREYLKKLNNEKVKVEEDKTAKASLYIAVLDKISIANIEDTYTRIQTIAHECLHSVQSRKLLLFNFIFSNIYLIYFFVICILAFLKLLPQKMMFLAVLLILSLIYYTVRVFLENDAMIKARYLAKEYMEEKKISTKEEIDRIVAGFDKINGIGIKCINYHFFMGIMARIFVFVTLCLLF